MRKRGFFPVLGLVFTLALTLGLMTAPASAKDYVKENLERKASYAVKDFGLELGGQVSNYKLNVTSAPSGHALYVIQAHTTKTYGDKVFFSLYYKGWDNKLYYTEKLNFTDAVKKFLDCGDALQAGQTNMISLSLPGNGAQEILGVYFYKNGGKKPLAIDALTVSQVSGSIGGVSGDVTGYRFREFSGQHIAYVSDFYDLDADTTDTGAIRYTAAAPQSGGHTTAHSTYALELVAGSDGYVNKNGTVTIQYTDTLGLPHTHSVRFREGYGEVQLNNNVQGADSDYNHTITSPWFETSVREMQGLASGYVGNHYLYQDVSETCLRPYTGTTFLLAMPQNIAQVDAITVSLDEDDSLILQSVRLIELNYLSDVNYWNGAFGLERQRAWSGRAVAQCDTEFTIPGRHSVRCAPDEPGRPLTNFPQGSGPVVDNRGTGVGVTIQLADVQGAGIESFLAWNGRDHSKPNFAAADQMEKRAGNDARKAWYNLNIFRQECMTLTVRYKDTLGATRQVDIPLSTSYLVYILKENQGRLSGGSWESWISGIFQQNENVALPMLLFEYKSLESIKLSYGSAPEGFVSKNSGTVDTHNDPIAIENICFYEGVTSTNFNSRYDSKKLACVLRTTLTPAYSYSAGSAQGQQLTGGGSLTTSLDNGTLSRSAPDGRDYSNQYLVRIKTADIETAGTTNPVSLRFAYTDTSGVARTTAEYSLPALAAGFYGANFRYRDSYDIASDLQYERHMRRNCLCEFVVSIDDLGYFDSITLSIDGTNEWQIEYIEVYALDSLDQRWGQRSSDGGDTCHIYWRRDFTGPMVANVEENVLFYQRSNQHTIYFTRYDESGGAIEPEQPAQKVEYLTTLPTSMTYEETLKNLGLAIPKFTYQVDVKVADLDDAGSGNYFYFQLVFENGASGVVLANQQLASDTFRRGMTESFQIKTTQNFGNVTSVRIICDNTSSTSDVFDKLNIERVSVTLSSGTGVSRSWVVDRVGWIDITYVDEGSDYGIDGLDNITQPASANVEVVKEFPVTGTATAVELLFCMTTSRDSAGISEGKLMSDPFNSALGGGGFNAVLYYRDSSGQQQSYAFDLTAQIKAYNDTDKTFWLYRPNHTDRFTVSLTDVQSIIALEITRSGGKGVWKLDSIAVSQIGGLGEVFLSPALETYYREPTVEADLTKGTNGQPVSIPADSSATISFQENSIEVAEGSDDTSWNTTISRIPDVSGEKLNIYLYSGTLLGRPYTFKAGDAVRATVLYTSVYGGKPLQNGYNISSLGEVDGQTVLYAKNLDISLMSAIRLLKLSDISTSTVDRPTISHAVIERVKGGVLLDTYYFDMGNANLGSTQPEVPVSGTSATADMNQVVRLQLASGQMAKLTPETSDIAVALRYTTALDPSPTKTVYQSPYFYLTDFTAPVTGEDGQVTQQRLYNAVSSAQIVDLPFDIDGIGEIVGLSVVSSGPNVAVDRAVIHNYRGGAGTNSSANLDSSCYISDSFVTSSIPSVLNGGDDKVVPVTFRFTTPAEEVVSGAGSSGIVNMDVTYQDLDGSTRSVSLTNLLSYLPEGEVFSAGATAQFTLLLPHVRAVTELSIQAQEDNWFIASASAQVLLPDGTSTLSETTVNNWSRTDAPLTIDIRPGFLRDDEAAGNQLLSFAVTGRGNLAGSAASAASGSALLVTAYPGDTVTLSPAVTVQGRPDASWVWVPGDYSNQLTIRTDGSASFYVPSSDPAGTSYTFSVHCSADQRLSVPITIAVEDPPPPPEPEVTLDFGFGGGDAGTGEGGSTSEGGES